MPSPDKRKGSHQIYTALEDATESALPVPTWENRGRETLTLFSHCCPMGSLPEPLDWMLWGSPSH